VLSNNELKERRTKIAAATGTIMFHGLILILLMLTALTNPEASMPEEKVAIAEDSLWTDSELVTDSAISTEEDSVQLTTKMQNTIKDSSLASAAKATISLKADSKELKPSTKNQTKKDATLTKTGNTTPEKQTENAKTIKTITREPNLISPEITYILAGREARNLIKPAGKPLAKGKIIVAIKVNKLGRVIYAVAGAKGSTISDSRLNRELEKAARNSIFAPDTKAPAEQSGTITYSFQG